MSYKFDIAALTVGVSLALFAPVSRAEAGVLDDYKKQAKTAGYQPLYPATDGVEPGQMYFVRDGSENVICESTFATKNPNPKNVNLVSIKANGTNEVTAGFSLSPDAVKNVAEASANLKSSGVSKGSISFSQPKTQSLPAQINKVGEKREVLGACAEQAATFFDQKTGKPNAEIYIITGTLSVGGITYDVNVAKNKEAGLKAVLQKLFTFNFGYKKTSDTTAQLTFQPVDAADRRVIGVKRVKVTTLKLDSIVSDKAGALVAGVEVPILDTAIKVPN